MKAVIVKGNKKWSPSVFHFTLNQAEKRTRHLSSHIPYNSAPESSDGGGGPSWTIRHRRLSLGRAEQEAAPSSECTYSPDPAAVCWDADGWATLKQLRVIRWAIKAVSLCIFILIQRLDVSLTNFLREPRIYFICQPFLTSLLKMRITLSTVCLSYVKAGIMWREAKVCSAHLSCFTFTCSRSSGVQVFAVLKKKQIRTKNNQRCWNIVI